MMQANTGLHRELEGVELNHFFNDGGRPCFPKVGLAKTRKS